MASEWTTARIGDYFELIGGYAFKSSEFVESGVPVIKIKNVKSNRMLYDDLSYVSPEFLTTRAEKVIRKGDLLITMSGNRFDGSTDTWVGKVAQFTEDRPFLLNQRVGILRPKEGVEAEPCFFRYSLSADSYQNEFIAIATSSGGQANLSPSQILGAPLQVPPLSEQKAIAQILGTLDEKIELDRRMNETLEGIAQTLFKSWFVDFDPVRVLAGQIPEQPPYLTKEGLLRMGFPDRLQGSELGEIPEGWRFRALGEVLDVKHGYAFEGRFFHDEPPGDILLTPGNFLIRGGYKGEKLKYYCGPVPEAFILAEHDLLLTMTDLSKASDTLGLPALLPSPPANQRFLHNQRLGKVIVTELNSVNNLFLYQVFCSDEYRQEILASSTGTTVKHTSPGRIKAFKTVLPPSSLMAAYERIMLPVYFLAANNNKQSGILVEMRDTLLPKLLSGEPSIDLVEEVLA